MEVSPSKPGYIARKRLRYWAIKASMTERVAAVAYSEAKFVAAFFRGSLMVFAIVTRFVKHSLRLPQYEARIVWDRFLRARMKLFF